MCGILGFAGHTKDGQWRQTHAIVQALFLASEHRGQDATGFAALTEPFKKQRSSKIIVDKQPLPARHFIKRNRKWRLLRHRRCTMVIGHVRLATHGSPLKNRNNHPHSSRDGRLHLIHNGIIEDHRRIAAKCKLRLKTDCDSEMLRRNRSGISIVHSRRRQYSVYEWLGCEHQVEQ